MWANTKWLIPNVLNESNYLRRIFQKLINRVKMDRLLLTVNRY